MQIEDLRAAPKERRRPGRGRDDSDDDHDSRRISIPGHKYVPKKQRTESLTREEYDEAMQGIWKGKGEGSKITEEYNAHLLERAKDRLLNESDNR